MDYGQHLFDDANAIHGLVIHSSDPSWTGRGSGPDANLGPPAGIHLWVRRSATPAKGLVLLVHGAAVRANIFRAPSGRNLVQLLADEG